jgi:D-xylose transport system substrate-binding protein
MKKVLLLSAAGILIAFVCFMGFSCNRRPAVSPDFQSSPRSQGYAPPDAKKGDRITVGFSGATGTFIIERWNKDLKVFSGAAQ